MTHGNFGTSITERQPVGLDRTAMIENQPAPSEASKPPPMWKQFLAFCLGLLSVFLGFYLGETFGGPAACLGMGAYFLIAQFLLSRGNAHAFLECGQLVAAMNCSLIGVFFVAGGVQLLLLLVITLASSFSGVVLATVAAGHGERERRLAHR